MILQIVEAATIVFGSLVAQEELLCSIFHAQERYSYQQSKTT